MQFTCMLLLCHNTTFTLPEPIGDVTTKPTTTTTTAKQNVTTSAPTTQTVVTSTTGPIYICKECNVSCAVCTSANVCTECDDGWELENGVCEKGETFWTMGAIIGIAVGGAALIILIIVAIVCVVKRKRRPSQSKATMVPPPGINDIGMVCNFNT